MKHETSPDRQRSNRRPSGLKIFFLLLLIAVAAVMLVLVARTVRQGSGKPAVRTGVVVAASTEPPTVTEPPAEAPTEPPLTPEEQWVSDTMACMTLKEKLCQLFVVTPEQLSKQVGVTEADETLKAAIKTYPVGGVILFGGNISYPEQVTALIGGMQEAAKIPLLVGVDEEGGIVSRLSGIGITRYYDSMAVYGSEGAVERVEEIGGEIADDICAVGFNVDFAPVADIVTNPNNTEIGVRSFSSDPSVASEMVEAMVRGLQDGGCVSCLKHFPGMGSTEADSHYGTSVSPRTLDELRSSELLPFRAGIESGAQMVMVSHMSLPNVLGDDTPCDLSPEIVTQLLREELGFDGVVITDSHAMASVTERYDAGRAALLAIQAGCDIVLMPDSLTRAVAVLQAAVSSGELTEERVDESVSRILTLKYRNGIAD